MRLCKAQITFLYKAFTLKSYYEKQQKYQPLADLGPKKIELK